METYDQSREVTQKLRELTERLSASLLSAGPKMYEEVLPLIADLEARTEGIIAQVTELHSHIGEAGVPTHGGD
jgi:hypothetical protein